MRGTGVVLKYMRIIHREIHNKIDKNFSYDDFKKTVKGNIKYFNNIHNNTKNVTITGNWIYESYLRDQLVLLRLKQKLSSIIKDGVSQEELELEEKELELKIRECELRFDELKSR